jgi:hypothetical protein
MPLRRGGKSNDKKIEKTVKVFEKLLTPPKPPKGKK